MRLCAIEVVHPRVACVRHRAFLSCSYVARTELGFALIDSGMAVDGAPMCAGIEALGGRVEDLRWILLTHWHNDHTAGAAALAAKSGAAVLHAPRALEHFTPGRRRLRHRIAERIPEFGPFALLKGIVGQAPPRPLAITGHIDEGDVVAGEIEVLATPGHSIEHLSFWWPSQRVLFAGDALAVCGGRISYMSRALTQDVAAAHASMRRLLELDAALICPGHRRPLTRDVDGHRTAALRDLAARRRWPLFS
ncbi:MAG: MBL fold metallo-hydrolase [Planctomycetota bacterium]